MKIWTKVKIKDKNKNVELVSRAFTNYLYAYGPLTDLVHKYNISPEDKKRLDCYTSNRIAGLLMLYLSKDIKRINDIANKYNIDNVLVDEVTPEIEAYINR